MIGVKSFISRFSKEVIKVIITLIIAKGTIKQVVLDIPLKPIRFDTKVPNIKKNNIYTIGKFEKYIVWRTLEKSIKVINATKKKRDIERKPIKFFNFLPPKNSEISKISEFSKFLKSLIIIKRKTKSIKPI